MAPDRIVSLAPSNTEILYELGAGERVVGRTALCDHPPAARTLPVVGGWTNPDVEAVREHDPDLVLASDALQDGAVERCRGVGMRVKQVTPTTLTGVCNSIKQIGEWTGAEEAAFRCVERMNDRLRDLPSLGDARVYTEEWADPPMAGGNWIPGLLEALGCEPFLDPGERSRAVEAGAVQAFDPEHIVLHYCGYGASPDPDRLAERDGWGDLRAVRAGNVHVVDDALLNRPGPRLVEGAERLSSLLE